MGRLPDLTLPPWLLAVVLTGGLAFYAGRYVGEGELRYLVAMPPLDESRVGIGMYASPRSGLFWQKTAPGWLKFFRVPDPDLALNIHLFPKTPPPAPKPTAPQGDSHDDTQPTP